jgi:segregation and condensation protein B
MAKKSQKKSKDNSTADTGEATEASANVLAGIASAADALAAFDATEDTSDVDLFTSEIFADSEIGEDDFVADTEDGEFTVATESMTDGITGSELDSFSSAEIEDVEEVSEEKIASVVESLLFSSDKPQSIALMKAAFSGTKVRAADIRKALEKLEIEYSNPLRGVELSEVAGGYQLRTKSENATYLQRTIKARPFRLSGPALEVLSIVAYKQPCTKHMVDEIRGVESGHLMRGLLERGLINFGEKSELPGRPMYYESTRKFLETFGLRSLQELPSLNEIDQLLPEGIDEISSEKKQTLSDLTGELSQTVGTTYSEGEQELMSISSELSNINLTTAFFDEEKKRAREKKDLERAQEIRERLILGEEVATRDKNWLTRYETAGSEGGSDQVQVQVSQSESSETVQETVSATETVSETETAAENMNSGLEPELEPTAPTDPTIEV